MNMRKYICAGLAFIVMGFAACTQNEDVKPSFCGQTIKAAFSIGEGETRVNTLGEGDKWENGDKVYVAVIGSNETAESFLEATVADGNTDWSQHKDFSWRDEGEHIIYVSYPYSENSRGGTFSLPTEQSSEKEFKSADYINGRWQGRPTFSPVDVLLQHRMAMVTVKCELGTADFDEGAAIDALMIESPGSGATFDFRTGDMTKTGSSVPVTAYKHDGNIFSAIILPGAFETGDEFITLSIGGKDYVSKLKMQTEFMEGYRYTYNLKIGKNKMELTQIGADGDLAGWTNEEELN